MRRASTAPSARCASTLSTEPGAEELPMPITHRSAGAHHRPPRDLPRRDALVVRLIMSGEMSPVMMAALHHRPARQEGDHRRDHRRGAGDARVLDEGRGGRHARTWSTSWAPAATARTPSTSRPARCSSPPRPAPRSASTAGAASAASPAAPTCSKRWALNIKLTPAQIAALHRGDRHRLHVRAEPPSGDEERRAGAQGARRAHDLQHPRAR